MPAVWFPTNRYRECHYCSVANAGMRSIENQLLTAEQLMLLIGDQFTQPNSGSSVLTKVFSGSRVFAFAKNAQASALWLTES
jgi:hypothetical protein